MWGGPGGGAEKPPGTAEEGSFDATTDPKDTSEQNKNQPESHTEIMLRNKQSLKEKEEVVQEYARKLSKIKSRTRLSRRSKDASSSSIESTPESTPKVKTQTTPAESFEDVIDDISQAKTPKAKSSLLQKKLAENRKIFEQRSKEMTENKRAVEEKVEAIRQQLEERDLTITELQKELSTVTPVRPLVITSQVTTPIMQHSHLQDKDNKIAELSNEILRLEATVLDLQENLKEKDSVIDSKTKAIMLMSADLSKKGKTTLDTLEETKDEMRTMQGNFVLIETSLKNKNDSLLKQLEERDNRIEGFEKTIQRLEQGLEKQRIADSATADFSRSTLDTLAETKDAMKSMQENFILIESSLKSKNDNLLQQLEERERKLAEAEERIFKLESGAGIVAPPEISELQYKLDKLEQSNRQLQDEKYELQKSIADLQDRLISNEPVVSNGLIVEKDNRIAELENLIEELRKSNQLLLEESKSELQNQIVDLSSKNEEYSNKISDLEKLVHDLESDRNEIMKRIPEEGEESREDAKMSKLTKELEELNKGMIKLKAQHKSKVKSLQKQLESFKKVSDANAELVKLGNQVTLLEEEKGNLQLSLVDFDELKASAGDWQERIVDLEGKVSVQANEIESQIQAIATLENHKLDLMQELHSVKQEVSALEAENAESENLRVTAEMKVVELEEQLDSLQKSINDPKQPKSMPESDRHEFLTKIEMLTQENNNLVIKLTKLEEKGTSDAGSTESFETLHETDRNELLKKIEILTQENNELVVKLIKLQEKADSNGGSAESFETLNDADRNELLKKVELLTQENNDLIVKLTKLEEKGSSDTGSTESFERIPEHTDNLSTIEILKQENNDLVVKLIKMEEKLARLEDAAADQQSYEAEEQVSNVEQRIQALTQENSDLVIELTKLREKLDSSLEQSDLRKIQKAEHENEERLDLQKRIDSLMVENNDIAIKHTKLEKKLAQLEAEKSDLPKSKRKLGKHMSALEDRIATLAQENNDLVIELTELQEKLKNQQSEITSEETTTRNDELQMKIDALTKDNNDLVIRITKFEENNESLNTRLHEITEERNELSAKVDQMTTDAFARERLQLIEKLEKLNLEKETVAQERLELHEEISTLLHKSTEETTESGHISTVAATLEPMVTVPYLENQIKECYTSLAEQTKLIEEMKIKLAEKEEELSLKTEKIEQYQVAGKNVDALQEELQGSLVVIEEWKLKCTEMQEKMQILEAGKTSIEQSLRALQDENTRLNELSEQKDHITQNLKQELNDTIAQFESKLNEKMALVSTKEQEIVALKEVITEKDRDLHDKYERLQGEMIMIDSLQDDLNNYKIQFQEKEITITSLKEEIDKLNAASIASDEKANSANNVIRMLREELQNSIEQLNNNQIVLNQMQEKLNEEHNQNIGLHEQIEKMELNIQDMQTKLTQMEHETEHLIELKHKLEDRLKESEKGKNEMTAQLSQLQDTLEQNNVYVDELRSELNGEYKKLELLKAKHIEDTGMQNRRLEDLVEELNSKAQENDSLRAELEEKHRLLGENVTEEIKIALESQVRDLEQKLSDSETKVKAQLEKMKKIAANLKKKAAQCQELEMKVSKLEEKWTLEKSEKETMNSKIQEVENISWEKDEKISNMEKQLLQSQNQTSDALGTVEKLTIEINCSKEKVASLLEQVTEMGEEIEKLQAEVNKKSSEIDAEKLEKYNLLTDFEAYKQQILQNDEKKQQDLDEAKENARELSVRMQVMESEYIDQLSMIQKLKAENGMLSSKETQINEKLENVEKESEERKVLLERLQKEKAEVVEKVEVQKAQTLECELREDTSKSFQEQCKTSVQALEAKLQERDAVIESLENELSKSNDKVNRLEEALVAVEERRRSLENRAELLGAELEQSFRITEEASFSEDMLEQRLAALMAKDEAIGEKLSDTIEENNELTEKIKSLQALNVSLQERIDAVEEELRYGRETTEKLQNVDVLYAELVQISNLQEIELKRTQQELQAAKQHIDNSEREVTLQINQLDSDKKQLLEKCEKLTDLKENLEQEIEALKDGVSLCRHRISELEMELSTQSQENSKLEKGLTEQKQNVPICQATPDEVEKLKSIIVEKDVEIENYQRRNMQLQMAAFDSSKSVDASKAFEATVPEETTKLNNLLSERESQCAHLSEEIGRLNQQTIDHLSQCEALTHEKQDLAAQLHDRDQHYAQLVTELQNAQAYYNQSQNEVTRLQQLLIEKQQEVDALNVELNNVGVQLQAQFNQQGGIQEDSSRLEEIISSKDNEIQLLTSELNSVKEILRTLEAVQTENNNLIEDKNNLIIKLEGEKSTFATELDDLKLQKQEAERIVSHIISVAEERVNNLHENINASTAITEETGLSRVELKLNEILKELDIVKREKHELLKSEELYRNKIAELEREVPASDGWGQELIDSGRVQELEGRLNEVLREKEILQLQVQDLTHAMDNLRSSSVNSAQRTSVETNVHTFESPQEVLEHPKPVEENVQNSAHVDVGSCWDIESTDKLDVEEEGWGWSAEEAQLEEQPHLSAAPLVPSAEIQLQTRIAELEDQIKDLEAEKEKLHEENKGVHVRSGKLVKKLKEFKVQIEQLQREAKQQKSSGSFCDLDSAIEEELKSQIDNLEKALKEAKDEQKKVVSEKEHLQKRLDVLMAANERFVEMKERQDMDVEVWQIRNKELTNKIQALQWQLQETTHGTNIEGYSMPSSQTESQIGLVQSDTDQSYSQISKSHDVQEDAQNLCKQYKEEIDDLKEEMEALAAENEELQKLLEDQKNKRMAIESKLTADTEDDANRVELLTKQNTDLQTSLDKLKEEYNLLRKQYEQSLMDANDQVAAMRQSYELLRSELEIKTTEFENEKQTLVKDLTESRSAMNELQDDFQHILNEKSHLVESIENLKSAEERLSMVSVSMGEVTELLNARVQEVADLKQELQQQYLHRAQAESNLQDTIQRLSHELNHKQQEIETLNQTFSVKESELIQQQSVETVSTIVSQATQELVQKHSIELESKDKEIFALKNTLAEKDSSMEKCNLDLQKDASNIETQRKEIEALRNNLKEMELILENRTSELNLKQQELAEKESRVEWYKAELQKYMAEIEGNHETIRQLRSHLLEKESGDESHVLDLHNQLKEINDLKNVLLEKESNIEWFNQEFQKYSVEQLNRQVEVDQLKIELQNKQDEVHQLRTELENGRFEMEKVRNDLLNERAKIDSLSLELQSRSTEIEHTRHSLIEKETIIEKTSHELNEKQREIDKLNASGSDLQKHVEQEVPKDSFPLFRMGGGDDLELQRIIENLKSELQGKEQEIEHMRYALSENTYPNIIQELQDSINQLHMDKAQIEQTLQETIRTLNEELASKQTDIEDLKQQISVQQREYVPRENVELVSRKRSIAQDQEEIVRLQNDLHTKEQEINELRYVITQKDSQISQQESFGSQSDDFDTQETIQRLNVELYAKREEIENLKATIVAKENEVEYLKQLNTLSEDEKNSIQKLTSENAQLRIEAAENLESKLKEKEMEIRALKQSLAEENQRLLESLQLKEKDIENLRIQMEKLGSDYNEGLHHKDDELLHVRMDLADKERRLAELSITKDAEIHNLKVQIHEKDVRIEELFALSEEEARQLTELRQIVEAKETEINSFKAHLAERVEEYEMIQMALKKDVISASTAAIASTSTSLSPFEAASEGTVASGGDTAATITHAETRGELDVALYMLHQRDVRCEELTLELMQLLEERDTLQLRLSNAIRVNEELRRSISPSSSPKKELPSESSEQPIIEQPSPSKSEGPVEIAKEAINSPIGEDKEALAVKLSQLHTVGHTRDVRYRDERELRHTQQMSLLTHKDILSSLPPEAAARLVNANYTLSRDVQSQSSVLMNWLWGKSTPKVMHM